MASFGYYRNKEPHKLIKLLLNRKLAIVIGVMCMTILLFLFSNKGFLKRISLEKEKSALVEHVRELEVENERLRLEEKLLTNDLSTIEHVAREKHGMIKPGEVVYRVREIKK